MSEVHAVPAKRRVTRWWRRPEAALFALVFGAYAYFYQAGGWNQNVHSDLTRALVEDHTLSIDRFADNTGDLAEKDDHLFCDKAPGLSLAGALPYALVYATFGSPHPSLAYLSWASWLSTVFAVCLPSALGVVALAFLLGALGVRGGPRYALAAAWGPGDCELLFMFRGESSHDSRPAGEAMTPRMNHVMLRAK